LQKYTQQNSLKETYATVFKYSRNMNKITLFIVGLRSTNVGGDAAPCRIASGGLI